MNKVIFSNRVQDAEEMFSLVQLKMFRHG